jgi:predicted cation transporter
MVGFFLAGLVVHGTLQSWWIEPMLSRLSEGSLLLSSVALSAFNDNAAITYLSSLVPHFSSELRYLVLSGAVAAGGLTIVANAPNPAGNALLARYFDGGISQLLLFVAAIFPLAVNLMFFIGFR